jgi:hypothetical protein
MGSFHGTFSSAPKLHDKIEGASFRRGAVSHGAMFFRKSKMENAFMTKHMKLVRQRSITYCRGLSCWKIRPGMLSLHVESAPTENEID